MKTLDKYIADVVVIGTAAALLVILGLDFFFTVISQVDDVGKGSYTVPKMLQYVALTLPRSIYELFPTAALLGGLTGMGALAANSELVAMRATGMSVWRIVRSVMQAGVVMLVFFVAMGEVVAPMAEEYGQRLRTIALDKRVSFMGRDGIWVRDESRYIYVHRIIENDKLAEIDAFEFGDDRQLISSTHVTKAEYRGGEWVLHGMHQSVFEGDSVSMRHEETITWPSLLTPELIDIVMLEPKNMSVNDIESFIAYLDANGLDTREYRYAYWGRFVTPFSSLVMLLISIPFVFGSLRSKGTGQRIFIGVLIGFGFSLLSQMLGQAGQVYGFNPLLVSFVPSLVVLAIGIYAIRRI